MASAHAGSRNIWCGNFDWTWSSKVKVSDNVTLRWKRSEDIDVFSP